MTVSTTGLGGSSQQRLAPPPASRQAGLFGGGSSSSSSSLLYVLTAFLMGALFAHNTKSALSVRGALDRSTAVSVERKDTEGVLSVVVSTTGRNDDAAAIMDLWWMSNLRQTPLQMTQQQEPTTKTNNNRRQFIFPSETSKVWVDVGVNQGTDFIVDLERDSSLFVLGFEPSKLWKPCNHKHCVVFWAACTPEFDVVNLNVQDGADLCDSLLKPNTDTSSRLWKGCVTPKTDANGNPLTVQVPGIPLRALVDRIPSSVQVEYIKIDAQGYDLEVMKGALGAPHGRIQVVSLEAMDVNDRSKLLYQGQPFFSEVKQYLEQAGWKHVKNVSNHGVGGEINAFFVSNEQFASKVDALAEALMGNKEGQGQK